MITNLFACGAKAPLPAASAPTRGYVDPAVSSNLNAFIGKPYSDTAAIEVYYATNRTKGNAQEPCNDRTFSVFRSDLVSYGLCTVNVPKTHATAAIEIAATPRENPHRYFMGLAHTPLAKEDFIGRLTRQDPRDVLVFIHGFNVAYQEAVMRAAQIAYDLKYQGPVLLFSWPAGTSASLLESALINRTYETNRVNAEKSVPILAALLGDLAAAKRRVHVLVHSMGHQVLVPALEIAAKDAGAPFIGELVLNAPDIDVVQFKSSIPTLQRAASRVTIYCSYNDRAISASETFNQNQRLGACAYLPDIDVVNVQEIDAPVLGLGHGYYASRAVLTDIFQILLGLDTEKRLFIRKSEPNSPEKYFLRP